MATLTSSSPAHNATGVSPGTITVEWVCQPSTGRYFHPLANGSNGLQLQWTHGSTIYIIFEGLLTADAVAAGWTAVVGGVEYSTAGDVAADWTVSTIDTPMTVQVRNTFLLNSDYSNAPGNDGYFAVFQCGEWVGVDNPNFSSGHLTVSEPFFETGPDDALPEQIESTLSPLAVSMGAIVLAEAARQTAGVLNYVFGRRPVMHYCFGATEFSGSEFPPINAYFPNTASGYVARFNTRIWVDPDALEVSYGYRCVFAAGHGGNIRTTIGAATAGVLAYTDADNGDNIGANFDVADTGTGWLDVLIELERTAGTGATNAYVRNMACRDLQRLVALPAPLND